MTELPSDEVLDRLNRVTCWFESQDWSGSDGATDWVVAQAVIHIVERCWRFDVALSVREVAEIAGITKETASRSLRRLRYRGLISRTKGASGLNAAEYQLNRLTCTHKNGHIFFRRSVFTMHTGCSDVFRRQGLGPNALRIWSLLLVRPLTVGELSLDLGIHRSTVRRNLVRLQNEGMASVRGQDNFWVSVCVELEHVAVQLGTLGHTVKQKVEHERQRSNFFASRSSNSSKDQR